MWQGSAGAHFGSESWPQPQHAKQSLPPKEATKAKEAAQNPGDFNTAMRLQLGPALGAKGMRLQATVGAGSGSAGRNPKVGAFAQKTPESIFNGVQ